MNKIALVSSTLLICYLNVWSQNTFTYIYTGHRQFFIVPTGVDSLFFDIRGAEGKKTVDGKGIPGKGGRCRGRIPVLENDTLYLVVGGQCNQIDSSMSNYGGEGGISNTGNHGGCGGGASVIKRGNSILALAAGGGGCGGNKLDGTGTNGGNGGGLAGMDGENGAGEGGTGGTQNQPGSGGEGAGDCGNDGIGGNDGNGGNGGASTCGSGFVGGGGGGGGFTAGGGGGGSAYILCCPDWSGGGGGGSSYTHPVVGGVIHNPGFQTGLGEIILTYYQNTNIQEQETALQVEIRPNPFHEYIVVDNKRQDFITATIFNGVGQALMRQSSDHGLLEFKTDALKPGVYFILIHSGNKYISSIIQHQN